MGKWKKTDCQCLNNWSFFSTLQKIINYHFFGICFNGFYMVYNGLNAIKSDIKKAKVVV